MNNSKTTTSRKTNNIPLESPLNLPPEMSKNFTIFLKFWDFRAPFENFLFSKNGHSMDKTMTTTTQFMLILNKIQLRSFAKNFIQKHLSIAKLEFFKKP